MSKVNGIELVRADLLRQEALIGGEWCPAASGKTLEVLDPADDSQIGTCPDMGKTETRRAIEAANKAWPAWRALTGKQRGATLRRWHDLVSENSEDLAKILTLEQGKPLAESRGEIQYALSFIDWFADEAKRTYGDVIPPPQSDKRIFAIKQPVGVCAAITAWNFPSALVTRKAAPALAAGCPVVLKPAEKTPFSALALGVLAEEAGVPAGVLNVVTGMPREIGAELTENKLVRKITFTGSTRVGRLLMSQSASTIKKLSLELGGNAPFIVFDDAQIDAAGDSLIASKFRASGQTCVCANRVMVSERVHDDFVQAVAHRMKTLRVGGGFEDGVNQGPLVNQTAITKVDGLVKDAIAKGATLILGGERHSKGPNFYAPTLLTGVTAEMNIAHEEIFGPVVAISRFHSDEEAIQLANSTNAGLASYFFTRDVSRAWLLAEQLEYGMVGVNTGMISNEVAPFGGIKQSGIGREGSRYGIDEFLELKYICLGGLDAAQS